MTMFHMSNDSHLFHTREQLEGDGWTLKGNIFERAVDGSWRRCCRCTRPRCWIAMTIETLMW